MRTHCASQAVQKCPIPPNPQVARECEALVCEASYCSSGNKCTMQEQSEAADADLIAHGGVCVGMSTCVQVKKGFWNWFKDLFPNSKDTSAAPTAK